MRDRKTLAWEDDGGSGKFDRGLASSFRFDIYKDKKYGLILAKENGMAS
jgi:hypothetical protein